MENNTQQRPSTSSEAELVKQRVPRLEQTSSVRKTQSVTTDLASLTQSRKKGGQVCLAKYGVEHYRDMGKRGGDATMQRHGADYYRRIGAMGREARRKKSKEVRIDTAFDEKGNT
jgi:hypothetical protein